MGLFNLKPYKRLARHRKKRDERRALAIYTNQIKGLCPRLANSSRVSDVTYLEFRDRYVHRATVMDLYTRDIVGESVSTTHTTALTTHALQDALIARGLEKLKFLHSDQCSEYLAKDYIDSATDRGITISMSKKASSKTPGLIWA